MHDAKGKSLKVGDVIVVPATITSVSEGEYCTLSADTVGVMPGNGTKNTMTLNTKQVYRANETDYPLESIDTELRDGKPYLI